MPTRPYKNDNDDYKGPVKPNNATQNTAGNTSSTPMTASQVQQIDLPKGLEDMHKKSYRPIMFRDNEVFNILTVLNKLDKPNALLNAKPGSGKSAIVRHIAELIDQKSPAIPTSLQDMHIYELSLTAIGSGNSLVGQTEQAIEDVIEFATDPDNHAIIFIDEVHQLFDEKDFQMGKLSQALKPAMARDNFRFIGATTTGESKTVLKDPAIKRRIEEVRLHDLTIFETQEIIKQALPRYRKHHNVDIDDAIIPDIIKLADQHYFESARPDNALTLLDQAASLKSMCYQQLTGSLPQPAINALPADEKTVTKETLITTINNHTGNAAATSPSNLYTLLSKRVKGQDDAIKEISDDVILFKSNILPSKIPLSLFLSGPTGNGKTETAKAITQALYNDPSRMTTINMTEYSHNSDITQLIGSPDGYVGSDSKRTTPFDTIYENPAQILLLDEFEKAAPDIHHLFYQILEEGFIEDRRGRHIDFSKSILIFTSNAVTELKKNVGFGVTGNSSVADKSSLIKAISAYVPDALLNRMTNVVKYESITEDAYKEIIKKIFNDSVSQMLDNRPDLKIDPTDLTDDILDEWSKKSYNKDLNGRPARTFVRQKISEATLVAIKNNVDTITITK